MGWGHKVLPGESFTNDITKAQGDSILRADMMKLCRLFSRFGRDSTLLSCLAYQVGPYRLLGSKDFPKSKLIQKLEAGNRDIYKEYISFRCYKGKVVPSIERRRKLEYLLLFEESKRRENLSVYFRQFSRIEKKYFTKAREQAYYRRYPEKKG